MNDKDSIKKISNPLTIIGMFAVIAEVAGTVVLPLVSESMQRYFIWYVMGFPVFLVAVFFFTLNKNPKVLYAPSDFSDEANFMKLVSAEKKYNETLGELHTSIQEAKKDVSLGEINKKIAPIEQSYYKLLLKSPAAIFLNEDNDKQQVLRLVSEGSTTLRALTEKAQLMEPMIALYLSMFEDNGLVSQSMRDGKIYFEITELGIKILKELNQ